MVSIAMLTLAMGGCKAGGPGAEAVTDDAGTGAPSSGPSGSGEAGTETGETEGAPGPGCEPGDSFTDPMQLVGRSESGSWTGLSSLAVAHPTVFACTENTGVVAWDVSDPAAPELIKSDIWPAAEPAPVHRCDHLAYDAGSQRLAVARSAREGEAAFVHVFAVDDVANPVSLGGWTGPAVEGLVFDGQRVHAAARSDGILVLELGADLLTVVGSYADASSDARKPALMGGRLVVAEGRSGLRVYDLAGQSPALLGGVGIAGVGVDVIVSGSRALVATLEGVTAVELGDGTAPSVIADFVLPGTTLSVTAAADDTVVVADWDQVRGLYTPAAGASSLLIGDAVGDSPLGRTRTVASAPELGEVYVGEWTGLAVYRLCGTAAPEIAVEPTRIDFRAVPVPEGRSRVLIVRNRGNRGLAVDSIVSSVATIVPDEDAIMVDAGGAVPLEVFFAPEHNDAVDATLVLSSDDPDEPELVVPVTGNVPGLDVGDPAPTFHYVDADGRAWHSDALAGQVGLLAYFATW